MMGRLSSAGSKSGGRDETERLESLWEGRPASERTMARLLIMGRKTGPLADLTGELEKNGFSLFLIPDDGGLAAEIAGYRPDMVLVAVQVPAAGAGPGSLVAEIRQAASVPVIALVARDALDGFDSRLDFDDFVVFPGDSREMLLRIGRRLRHTEEGPGELMGHEGLVIDQARCEVMVDGEAVDLTFREYELLKFLAGHKGRVYTREALLNQVWGYDYYGGDRTVDVHIRRLRGKIEGRRKYIDTIRNIGYRFHDK